MKQNLEHSWNPMPARFPASLSPHPHLKLLLRVVIAMENTLQKYEGTGGEQQDRQK